jgi:hypothetical protein
MDLRREKPSKNVIDLRKRKTLSSLDDGALSALIRKEMKTPTKGKQTVNRTMKTNKSK